MPQMSPMDWMHIVFWFSFATNYSKSKSRNMTYNSFNTSKSSKKISMINNNMKW